MKNKRIILERVKVAYGCKGCFFYSFPKCTYRGNKFPCLEDGKSYIWKEVKQKKEVKNG